MEQEQAFEYRAVDAKGVAISGTILAAAKADALRRLGKDGVVVLEIRPLSKAGSRLPFLRSKSITSTERVLLLHQLALLTRAGIDLLDSLDTIASGMDGRIVIQVQSVAAALRRGERLAAAFAANAPGFPDYVYALIGAGEASGDLGQVLEDAAALLEFDERVRKDVMTALTYPMFLVCAGAGAIAFLFYEVVPQFAAMIGKGRDKLTGLPDFVMTTGELFRANALLVFGVLIAAVLVISTALTQPAGKRALYGAAHRIPAIGALLGSRERAIWARIMSFALRSGVAILDASQLASRSVPQGPLRRGLDTAGRAIRAGKPVDQAFGESGMLHRIDLSLLKAGQRSGQLPAMFGFIGQRHENDLKDNLKRATALIEPLAISFVAIAIGAVAIGLVTAMTSVYDNLG